MDRCTKQSECAKGLKGLTLFEESLEVADKFRDDYPLGLRVKMGNPMYEKKIVVIDVYSGSTVIESNSEKDIADFAYKIAPKIKLF